MIHIKFSCMHDIQIRELCLKLAICYIMQCDIYCDGFCVHVRAQELLVLEYAGSSTDQLISVSLMAVKQLNATLCVLVQKGLGLDYSEVVQMTNEYSKGGRFKQIQSLYNILNCWSSNFDGKFKKEQNNQVANKTYSLVTISQIFYVSLKTSLQFNVTLTNPPLENVAPALYNIYGQ